MYFKFYLKFPFPPTCTHKTQTIKKGVFKITYKFPTMLCFQAKLQLKPSFSRQNNLSLRPQILVFGKENEQYSLRPLPLWSPHLPAYFQPLHGMLTPWSLGEIEDKSISFAPNFILFVLLLLYSSCMFLLMAKFIFFFPLTHQTPTKCLLCELRP